MLYHIMVQFRECSINYYRDRQNTQYDTLIGFVIRKSSKRTNMLRYILFKSYITKMTISYLEQVVGFVRICRVERRSEPNGDWNKRTGNLLRV